MKTVYFLWKQMTVSMKLELYQSTREYNMSHIPEHNKQRELEKKLIKIDAIKRILRKEFRYISHSTDTTGLLIDIETIKRSL
jgi:predicted hydrolase (HD superfamily)